jgi:predicted HTH transcriptional regulator
MNEAMQEAGLKKPDIQYDEMFFFISFKRPSVDTRQALITGKSSLKGLGETLHTGSEKMTEKMTEKTPGRILSALTGHPEATIADLSVVLGVSNRTIERNLKRLQAQGHIRRVGPAKGGYWEVVNAKTKT